MYYTIRTGAGFMSIQVVATSVRRRDSNCSGRNNNDTLFPLRTKPAAIVVQFHHEMKILKFWKNN